MYWNGKDSELLRHRYSRLVFHSKILLHQDGLRCEIHDLEAHASIDWFSSCTQKKDSDPECFVIAMASYIAIIMNDLFELPVTYKGKTLLFPAELLQTGYTHKFRVEVYEQEVLFEPDEEQNYRALLSPDSLDEQIDIELLKAIAGAIEAVLK